MVSFTNSFLKTEYFKKSNLVLIIFYGFENVQIQSRRPL